MLSKNQIKLTTSLAQKKNRDELNMFVAEGTKLVLELLPVYKLIECFATTEWIEENEFLNNKIIQTVTFEELKKISNQKSPQGVLAIFEKPSYTQPPTIINELCLALDDVQDPGNLGTIVRIADWFGIRNIICTNFTADVYGSKTVQSTMGAIARVKVHYVDLVDYISKLPSDYPVYGTFMDGKNIYTENLTHQGLIIMGNEGNGISNSVAGLIKSRITIPHFSENEATSESLNVAVATSIVCSEFRRKLFK